MTSYCESRVRITHPAIRDITKRCQLRAGHEGMHADLTGYEWVDKASPDNRPEAS